MAEENLAGIKIKDSYEGLLHLSDGGLSTTPGLPTAKPVYDGQGRQTCLNVSSNMLTIKGVAAGLAIDSTNDGDYGFIDQGTTNSGIGLRGNNYYDGTQPSDLYVAYTGNVGIGLEDPIARLQTIPRGSDIANDFTDAGLLVGTVAEGVAIDADAIRCSTTGSFKIGMTNGNTTGTITFHTNGDKRLDIQADGKMRYPYVHPNHGGPANGKVLTCVGSNGGMAWKSTSAEVQHNGTTATKLDNCTVARTSAGKYTITIDDNGSKPTAVGSLAHAWAAANPGDNNGNMDDQYSISVRTISNTQIKVEIIELYVRVDRSDGDDDFEMSQFYRVFRDRPFQVIIFT